MQSICESRDAAKGGWLCRMGAAPHCETGRDEGAGFQFIECTLVSSCWQCGKPIKGLVFPILTESCYYILIFLFFKVYELTLTYATLRPYSMIAIDLMFATENIL